MHRHNNPWRSFECVLSQQKQPWLISFGPINPIPFPALKQLTCFFDEYYMNWLPFLGTLLYEKNTNRSLNFWIKLNPEHLTESHTLSGIICISKYIYNLTLSASLSHLNCLLFILSGSHGRTQRNSVSFLRILKESNVCFNQNYWDAVIILWDARNKMHRGVILWDYTMQHIHVTTTHPK